MLTGIIVFDLEGEHYLETFDGLYHIPEETFDAARNAIMQDPEHVKIQYEGWAGKLARGILSGDVITSISFRMKGREWPSRSVYGPNPHEIRNLL
jgi:hypothetical protein